MAEEKKDSVEDKEKTDIAAGGESIEGDQTAPSDKSKKKKKIIIIITAIILLLLLIVGGLYFTGFFTKLSKHEAESKTTEKVNEAEHSTKAKEGEHSAAAPAAPEAPIYKQLQEFLVDLKTGSSASFIKIDIILKVPNQDSSKAIDDKLPVIRDSFIGYLRELKSSDLYGSSGLFILKQELLLRVNKIIFPAIVDDIYIQNILTR